MSAGTRSRAMTATAPASSAILAWSAVTTSMMTPPLSISARPRLTRAVPVTWLLGSMLENSLDGPSNPLSGSVLPAQGHISESKATPAPPPLQRRRDRNGPGTIVMEHPRSYVRTAPSSEGGPTMRACGGDGGDGGTQAAAPPQPAKVTVTASATGDQVTFDVPAQIKPGATELTLVNKTKEQVEFQIVQL